MTEENFNRLMALLDSMSKKLTSLKQKVSALEKENWSLATYVGKLEVRINELESNSDV
jgi:BMFP domain-containing protein YqiC